MSSSSCGRVSQCSLFPQYRRFLTLPQFWLSEQMCLGSSFCWAGTPCAKYTCILLNRTLSRNRIPQEDTAHLSNPTSGADRRGAMGQGRTETTYRKFPEDEKEDDGVQEQTYFQQEKVFKVRGIRWYTRWSHFHNRKG